MSNKLLRMIIGIIKIPFSSPIEILFVMIMMVILYASIATMEFKISLVSGCLLSFYLYIKGRKQK